MNNRMIAIENAIITAEAEAGNPMKVNPKEVVGWGVFLLIAFYAISTFMTKDKGLKATDIAKAVKDGLSASNTESSVAPVTNASVRMSGVLSPPLTHSPPPFGVVL